MPEAEEGNRTEDGKIVQVRSNVTLLCCMCKHTHTHTHTHFWNNLGAHAILEKFHELFDEEIPDFCEISTKRRKILSKKTLKNCEKNEYREVQMLSV